MPSINLGMQADLKNQGTNKWRSLSTTRPCVISSFQLSVSALASNGMNNQVLFIVQWMPVKPVTTGIGPNYPSNGFFTPSDWGYPEDDGNPNNLTVNSGGWGNGGALSIHILKLAGSGSLPSSDNQCSNGNSLNLAVPAGSYILAHMDHTGDAVECDCEMQGVLHYA